MPIRAFRAIAVAVSIFVAPSALAEAVGQTTAIQPQATQRTGGAPPAALQLRDQVMRNATLETARGGALEVTFADSSKLSMGENSQATVDAFTYDGQGLTGAQALNFQKGLFRFQSGAVPKDKVKLETPAVTIGIRGTTLRIKTPGDGTSTVGVDDDGQHDPDKVLAVVISKATGQIVELRPGQYVTFDVNGAPGAIQQGTVPGCE